MEWANRSPGFDFLPSIVLHRPDAGAAGLAFHSSSANLLSHSGAARNAVTTAYEVQAAACGQTSFPPAIEQTMTPA